MWVVINLNVTSEAQIAIIPYKSTSFSHHMDVNDAYNILMASELDPSDFGPLNNKAKHGKTLLVFFISCVLSYWFFYYLNIIISHYLTVNSAVKLLRIKSFMSYQAFSLFLCRYPRSQTGKHEKVYLFQIRLRLSKNL